MSDRDADHTLSELQEARAEVDRLRSDLARLRWLILKQTSVTCNTQKYWPEWVNKYFDSIGPLPKGGVSDE
jgi:hypothetical protein